MTLSIIPSSKEKTKKVMIVDDHPIVREGLAHLIDLEDDLEVCAWASCAEDAIEAVKKVMPDLVTVDINLKGTDGIEMIKRIVSQFGPLPMLVISMHDESFYAERALRAGAKGYIMKEQAAEHLIGAIRRVLEGEIYLSAAMENQVLQKLVGSRAGSTTSPLELLSDRELEVFRLLGQGLGSRTISARMHLSIKTIETYRGRIKQKLGLDTAEQLVHRAFQWAQAKC